MSLRSVTDDGSYDSTDGRLTPESPGEFVRSGSQRNSRNRLKLHSIDEANKTIITDENTELLQTLMKSQDTDDDKVNHERQGSFKRRRRRMSSADILGADRERAPSPKPPLSPDLNTMSTRRRRSIVDNECPSVAKMVFEHKQNSFTRSTSIAGEERPCSPLASADVTTLKLNRTDSGADGDCGSNFRRTRSERFKGRYGNMYLDNKVQQTALTNPPDAISETLTPPRRRRTTADVDNRYKTATSTTSTTATTGNTSIDVNNNTSPLVEKRSDSIQHLINKTRASQELLRKSSVTCNDDDVKSITGTDFDDALKEFNTVLQESETKTDRRKSCDKSSVHPAVVDKNQSTKSYLTSKPLTSPPPKKTDRIVSSVIPKEASPITSTIGNVPDATLTVYTGGLNYRQRRESTPCEKQYDQYVREKKDRELDSSYKFHNFDNDNGDSNIADMTFESGYSSLPRHKTLAHERNSEVTRSEFNLSGTTKKQELSQFDKERRERQDALIERSKSSSINDYKKRVLTAPTFQLGAVTPRGSLAHDEDKDNGYDSASDPSASTRTSRTCSTTFSNTLDGELQEDSEASLPTDVVVNDTSVSTKESNKLSGCSYEMPGEKADFFAQSCESLVSLKTYKSFNIDLTESGNTTDTSMETSTDAVEDLSLTPTATSNVLEKELEILSPPPTITVSHSTSVSKPQREHYQGTLGSGCVDGAKNLDVGASNRKPKSSVIRTITQLVSKPTKVTVNNARSPTTERRQVTSQAAQKVTERLTGAKRAKKPSVVSSVPPTTPPTGDVTAMKTTAGKKKTTTRPLPRTAISPLTQQATARMVSNHMPNRSSDTSSVKSSSSDESTSAFSRFDPNRRTMPAHAYSSFKREAASKREASSTRRTPLAEGNTQRSRLLTEPLNSNTNKPATVTTKPKRTTALSTSASFSVYDRLSNPKKTTPKISTTNNHTSKVVKPTKTNTTDPSTSSRLSTDKKTRNSVVRSPRLV